MSVENTIKEFIEKRFLRSKEGKGVSNEDVLLSSGLIDSSGIFELVSFIEKEFNVEVSDGEITSENFETISNIVAFVSAKQNG